MLNYCTCRPLPRDWKGFRLIRELAGKQSMNRDKTHENTVLIREFIMFTVTHDPLTL